jgi:hypothetical protein
MAAATGPIEPAEAAPVQPASVPSQATAVQLEDDVADDLEELRVDEEEHEEHEDEEEEEGSEEALLAVLGTPAKNSEPQPISSEVMGDLCEREQQNSPATKGSLSLPSGVPMAAAGVGGTPDAEDLRKRRLARFGQ